MTIDGQKLIAYMKAKDWRVRTINIVYLEDVDPDTWEPKPNEPDKWNDARILVRDNGEVIMSAEATTEPGRYYTEHRLNPLGAFRIALDTQFTDAWTFGGHGDQLALVQCKPVKGYRDNNEDYIRPGDPVDEGIFGINQHTTGNNATVKAPVNVGKWSAGCLVGRHASTHYNVFIPTLKNSGRLLFDTVVIGGNSFHQWKP